MAPQPDNVVWISPEELDRSQGEYREVEGHNEDGTTDLGGLVVWVDDAPEDDEDGSGHFESYDGDESDYFPEEHGVRLTAHADLFYRDTLAQTSREQLKELIGAPRSYVDRMLWRLGLQSAETFTEEGLSRVLNIFPRNTVAITDPLFMLLFTSQTASTTPAKTATGGAAPSGFTEVTGGGYARVSTAGTNWPAPATSGSGMRTTMTGTGMSFAESTGAYSGAVNGFGFATAASSQAGDTTIFFANFADGQNITVNAAGYTIRVAAYWHYDV